LIEFPEIWEGFMDDVCEALLEEEEVSKVDAALRVMINLLSEAKEEHH